MKNHTDVWKGVMTMMLVPGVMGWLMTMTTGSVNLFNFIRLFIPMVGE